MGREGEWRVGGCKGMLWEEGRDKEGEKVR